MQTLLSESYKHVPRWTFINSWHMNEQESAAMWKVYAKSDRSIAIQSTASRLVKALCVYNDVYVGEVSYIDYDREPIPEGYTFYPFLHKRKSFEHERELRAVIQTLPINESGAVYWSMPQGSPGQLRRVALGELVEAVYVSPGSPPWFVDVVRAVSAKFGLARSVEQSALDREPFY